MQTGAYTIDLPVWLFGFDGDRTIRCAVSEKPDPREGIIIYPTAFHSIHGYTVAVKRSGELHEIGWVDPVCIEGDSVHDVMKIINGIGKEMSDAAGGVAEGEI